MSKVNPDYRKKIEQINQDGEDYANEQMKSVYSEQKNSLDEVHKLIGLLFIKYAIDGLLKLNPSQKASILSDIDKNLRAIGKNLGQNEVDKVTAILSKTYSDTYYKNAYMMDNAFNVDLKVNILKKEFIDTVFLPELFNRDLLILSVQSQQ